MTAPDPFDQLNQESKKGAPAISFATLYGRNHPRAGQPTGFRGIAKGGTVISVAKQQSTDPDNNLKFWPIKPGQTQGDPIMVWVFTLQTTEKDPANAFDNGVRSLWAEEGTELYKAIMGAIRESQIKVGPGVGVYAAWVGERPSKKPGAQDAKLFQAKIVPADQTALAADAAAYQPAQQPVPAQAPVQQPQTYVAPPQQAAQPVQAPPAAGNPFTTGAPAQAPAQQPQQAPAAPAGNPFANI